MPSERTDSSPRRHAPSGEASSGDGSLVTFPRVCTPERPPNNLPLELSSFVGREQETDEVKGLLDAHRLLTLTGPGGCGKTRLALKVAGDLLGAYPDGVWLVELASLSESGFVPQAVASVFGVRETPGTLLVDSLRVHLESREALLVLDNCEHLVEACADLTATLLRSCLNLRVLATSREVLGVPGEMLFAVPPLSLPDPRHLPALGNRSSYEAAELFVERARAVRPDFALTEQNALAVAQVCHRLDGIPLAIELAAARVRVLSVDQISSRLKDCFALLSDGGRTAKLRHKTLRATMDWSHELLSEEEKVLFRRLSVFAGGFTLEAAEEVCSGEGLERFAVLDLLTHLVDKSLVVTRERDEEVRYRLLEMVRQYGWEELQRSGEAEVIRRRRARFFLAWAEEVEPRVNTADRRRWLERLDAEHDNLRATLRWAGETGEAEMGLRLAGSLFWFWFHRGYWSEGYGWLKQTLAAGGGAGTAARAKVLRGAGASAWVRGYHATARSQLEESIKISREVGDEQTLAHALSTLGLEMLGQSEPAAARLLAEEGLEVSRRGEDTFVLTTALTCLGIVVLNQGDHSLASSLLEESVEICREAKDNWSLSLPLRNLGTIAFRQGDHERAAALFRESLSVLREQGEKWYVTRSLEYLAAVASMQGDHARAARLYGAGEALREVLSVALIPYSRADYDRGAAAARGALGEESFAAAWSEGWAMTLEQAIEYALGGSPHAGTEPPATPRERLPAPTQPLYEPLTGRELEVLGLISLGLSNRQIADRLFVAVSTVKTYVNAVFKKLGVSSRTQAVAKARKLRLLSE